MIRCFLIVCALRASGVSGFGAPGIVPPESFKAERWYPSNLPTVMPPWKMAGVDISNFRTARPHQSPGTNPVTTTPTAPTDSLPMPPGTSTDGPHPPSPPPPNSVEASGVQSSAEQDIDGSAADALNSTSSPSSTEELMTIGVTESNMKTEKPEEGVLRILSPVFEDITKMDNISDSEEVLKVESKMFEGSGDHEAEELTSTLETTTPEMEMTKTTTESSTKPVTTTSSTTTTTISTSTIATTTTTASTTSTTSSSPTPSTSNHLRDEENTTEVKLHSNSTKECKDILFLLDSSGNVVQQYEKQKKYIEEIVHHLEEGHPRRMALITYAGRTRQKIVVPLPEKPNGQKFLEKLKKARFLRGVTASGAAISVTTQYVLQKSRKVQVIVVTDGFSFDDVERQSEALRALIGQETYVTGRYFPVVRNVLLSIGGSEDHIFSDKREQRLIEELQC